VPGRVQRAAAALPPQDHLSVQEGRAPIRCLWITLLGSLPVWSVQRPVVRHEPTLAQLRVSRTKLPVPPTSCAGTIRAQRFATTLNGLSSGHALAAAQRLLAPMAYRADAVRMKIWPSEIAGELSV
jgi:hypothetical protein